MQAATLVGICRNWEHSLTEVTKELGKGAKPFQGTFQCLALSGRFCSSLPLKLTFEKLRGSSLDLKGPLLLRQKIINPLSELSTNIHGLTEIPYYRLRNPLSEVSTNIPGLTEIPYYQLRNVIFIDLCTNFHSWYKTTRVFPAADTPAWPLLKGRTVSEGSNAHLLEWNLMS